ncbi:Uncharacterised protein [Acinetobacter baumannii]|nr:Uncharacterised protein [Acinetobacter baumannii]SSU54249.1 Uncharacterised protein [Acinetobacter baumannii]SSU68187.1 Uncharacterised protein [Acinetobacter baumannii]SSV47359.1 Uncharacterised protein [Acinetobacter baumannii]SUU68738.1 Uncharacterised protein [Acinetobacter baumannii]
MSHKAKPPEGGYIGCLSFLFLNQKYLPYLKRYNAKHLV